MNGEASQQPSGDRTAQRATTTLEVEIFGSTYRVRGENDPAHLERLASIVDGKMREIAPRLNTVETSRIAILAALNLADELIRAEGGGGSGEAERTERANGLLDQLEKVLSH